MGTVHFRDTAEPLESYVELFLVRCPQCGSCASVAPEHDPEAHPLFRPRRLTCTHCGLAQRWKNHSLTIDSLPTDWYFHLPLWLQAPCVGRVLWAFNAAHLSFLEGYVRATDRRRIPYVNRSAASRLPEWIKSAKNRAAVLQATAVLGERLRQC